MGQWGQVCSTCYELTAPLTNRLGLHWDFTVIETATADSYGPVDFDYVYHVGNSFTDVPPSSLFYYYIEALYTGGVVSGCQSSPLMYCPSNTTQRQAMAKFVCAGMDHANPGTCTTATCTGIFTDVPTSNVFCSYIEALFNGGVISGCGTNLYCPTSTVSRGQMAKFLVNGFGFAL